MMYSIWRTAAIVGIATTTACGGGRTPEQVRDDVVAFEKAAKVAKISPQ